MRTAREWVHDELPRFCQPMSEFRGTGIPASCFAVSGDHSDDCDRLAAAIEARDAEHGSNCIEKDSYAIRALTTDLAAARRDLATARSALVKLRDIAHDNRDWGMRTIAEDALAALTPATGEPT